MPLMQSPPGPVTRIDGREYLYFVGTGYLGLQGRPEVIAAACEAAEKYGIGSANSRTAFGTTPPVVEVEKRAAAMFGMDDAFYFASGWMGGHILMQSIGGNRLVLVDEGAHYSLFEAARAGGSAVETFRHRQPDDLRAKLKSELKPGQTPVVLSDGVFAVNGRIAPVTEYVEILKDYAGAVLCLDDAHGIGVLGENGRGTFEHAGLWACGVNGNRDGGRGAGDVGEEPSAIRHSPSAICNPSPALLVSATLSKAIGGYGGIIPGSREFMAKLKSTSAYMGGASAPPTPIAAASARALDLVMAEPALRHRLHANARLLKNGLGQLGFALDDTPTPIVCLEIGTAESMQRIQRELFERGIAIAYMATYSGLGPAGGLRMAVFATHTEEMIGRLVEELGRQI